MKDNNSGIVKINMVGDIMLGDSAHMLSIGVGNAIFQNEVPHIFSKVASFFKKADVNIGNLECTFPINKSCLGSDIKPYQTYSPEHAKCLNVAGFHIVNMANNHTMQYGTDVFNYTEENLMGNNIQTIGTVKNPYHILEIKNVKFAFLGYSLRPNQFKHKNIQYINGNRRKIFDDVQFLKEENNHVVVSFHWGDEFVDYPSQEQIILSHEIIDAGASLIIGHHPHILQGMEYYKNGLIAYSLGNFVFDKPQKLQRKSAILQCVFSKDRLEGSCLVPIYINNNFQPEIASERKKRNIESLINKLNNKIKDSVNIDRRKYDKDVIKGLRRMQLQFNIFFLSQFYRYSPKILFILIKGAIIRKLRWEKT